MSQLMSDLKAKIEEMRQEMVKEATSIMNVEFRKVFEEFPELQNFSWRQYTPGFNDGDPCYFTVDNGPESITINDNAHDNEAWVEQAGERVNGILDPLIDGWQERDKGTNIDLLKQAFGDNVTVTINRDGTSGTQYYECGY